MVSEHILAPPAWPERGLRRAAVELRRWSAVAARASAAACILLAASALLGWVVGSEALRSMLPGSIQMKANTAVALILAGLALLLHTFPRGRARRAHRARRSAQWLGAAVSLIGIASAAEYVFAQDLGIDQVFVRDPGGPFTTIPGRMSPFTAVALTCMGIALLAAPVARLRVVATTLAGTTALIGVLSAVGYLWGAPELVTDQWATPLAANTALACALLGSGLLVALPRFMDRRPGYRLLLDAVERKLVTSFVAALLALIAVGSVAYRGAAEYAEAWQRLAGARAFRNEVMGLYADLTNAALAQRGYLVSGDPDAAARWSASTVHLAARRSALRERARELGPAALVRVSAFDDAAGKMLATLQQEVDLYRNQGPEAARASLRSGRATVAIDDVSAWVARLDRIEGEAASRQEEVVRRGRERTRLVTVLTWLAAAALLGGGFVAIRREMEMRAGAERRLRRGAAETSAAQRFLESVIRNIPHMIFIKEAGRLRFVDVNRGFEEITGWRKADVVGRSDADFFPAAQAEFFVGRDREVLESGRVLDIPEEEIQSAGGGTRLLHTKKIPLCDAHGRPTHLLGISADVTAAREQDRQIRSLNRELEARAAEVERVNRAKSDFLATMSHEIRTPMNGMLGMLELLSLTPLDERQRQTLFVVRESGQSLLRIIDDILDFSKIEAEKLELREEVASIAGIVRDIRTIHAAAASGKGLVVTSTVDPALAPALWVDPVRLRQVLNNFVSNAVKFTSDGSVELRLKVVHERAEAQTIRFTVTDTGAGISEEEQQQLFHPFVQVGGARNGAAGGTGLGLVISRRLVERMGGTVTLRSAPGHGTEVSFTIELRTASPALLPKDIAEEGAELRVAMARVRSAPDLPHARADGTLVLLVDDHPVNRMLLEQQLTTLGYACETASDGAAALERYRTGGFGLVITDCQMPGMDGYELARRVRATEAAQQRPRVPILACTAMVVPGELRRCLDAGMDDCLLKPVQLVRLREKLDRWLPLPRNAQDLSHASPQAPRTVAPPSAAAAVDIPYLEGTWGSDPATVHAIKEAYARSAREDRAALHAAAAARDLPALMQVTHRMVGASRMVGAHALAEASAEVNALSRQGDWDVLTLALDAFEAEYARVERELQ